LGGGGGGRKKKKGGEITHKQKEKKCYCICKQTNKFTVANFNFKLSL
jgi:hypothetical protein